jgi:hypothetical protein
MTYPKIRHVNGAIHEIVLLFFTGCTEVALLTAGADAAEVGLVSAMTQLIFRF